MPDKIRYRVGDRPNLKMLAALRESVGWSANETDYPRVYKGYSTTIAAYSQERLIGWAALVSDHVRHAYFVEVLVDPLYQRQGVGRQLVMRGLETEREKGVTLFFVEFSPENTPFYEACGFKPGVGATLDMTEAD